MSTARKRAPISFRVISVVAIVLSLVFITIGIARFFAIESILNVLPETTKEVLEESPLWVYYVYLITVLTNLFGITLLFKRSVLTVLISQISAAGMMILIPHHFFTTDNIHVVEAIEMLATLSFYIMLAWYATYARKNGYLLERSIGKTTVVLKVQEGCNNKCGYCTVPFRNGASRSNSLENIVDYAKQMAERGIKDVVITGDNVGDYGTGEHGDLEHEHNFLDLLQALNKVGGIHRFRFESILTPLFSTETLYFFKNSLRFSPHFDIRMQSGSNEVLEKMNSPYKKELYRKLFENIKEIMPEAYISIEIMVGFPGETDELFLETVKYLADLNISYINVKPYTKTPDTSAYKIKKGIVSKAIRAKRINKLNKLSKKKLNAFYRSQLDTDRVVLFENKNKKGYVYGYTENHIRVKTYWDPELGKTLHKICLREIDKEGIVLFDFKNSKITENHSVSI